MWKRQFLRYGFEKRVLKCGRGFCGRRLIFGQDFATGFSSSVKKGGMFFFEFEESLFHKEDFVVGRINQDFQDVC